MNTKHPHTGLSAQAALLALCGICFCSTARAALPADTGIDWNLTPERITETCKSTLAQARERIRAIDAQAAPVDFAHGLAAIEAASADAGDALIAQTQLAQIAVEKKVRDAATHCVEDVSAFGVELGADPKVLQFATSAAQGSSAVTAVADHALAEHYVEVGRLAGAQLEPAKRRQVSALFNQLNKLEIAFGRALGEDRTTIEIGADEAASLPPGFVATLKKRGARIVVDVNESTVQPFMDNEAQRPARARYFRAYNSRGGAANVSRLAAAVRLRDRIARLLGFDSWASYKLSAQMAKTPERANALLAKVDAALLPKAREEIAVLAALKREAGDATPFERWDYAYFETQLEKRRYAVDTERVRRYFPVQKVIASVFDIYQHLLGVRFDALDPAVAWAPGVLEYAITDVASDKPIGWFFLDLYPRPGKYNHFAMFALRQGRALPDGSFQKPVSAIIGNWPAAEPGKPALLSHDDVVTFFHEFGHLMHNSLSTAPYETLYGTNVRQDFVEAPSQMLENWMWQASVLKRVSANVDTGEPLPDDLIASMLAAKHVADGVRWSRQAFYATYDMTLHSSGGVVDPTRLWFDLAKKMTPFAEMPGTIPEAGFGHLMGGYDAGYYGYLWSLVYGQDMFSVFEQGGLDSAEVGMRYRHDILEPGATLEPDQLLRNFLGRPVSYEPFYKYVGASGLAP